MKNHDPSVRINAFYKQKKKDIIHTETEHKIIFA